MSFGNFNETSESKEVSEAPEKSETNESQDTAENYDDFDGKWIRASVVKKPKTAEMKTPKKSREKNKFSG